MKTIIKSLPDAIDMISFKKTDYNIVSLRSTDMPPAMYEDFDIFRDNYKDIIVQTFDDIVVPIEGYKLATIIQITSILVWARERDNILVHCSAGVCRSSAIAYLIECIDNPPKKAVKILDRNKHYPNGWVVRLGSNILNKPEIEAEIENYYNSAFYPDEVEK